MLFKTVILCFLLNYVENVARGKMEEYFSWKQIGYDFYGIRYTKDSDFKRKPGPVIFKQELNASEQYFIQYNNVPIGLAVRDSNEEVFVSVPRRRYGIPSTLNFISGHRSHSPLLTPLPAPPRETELVSVYRPAVDRCARLWMVDTGLLEVPDGRRQVQPPSITIYDLQSREFKRILKYELKATDLVNDRTSGGLTSITVEVSPNSCDDAYAYINDLATGSLVVFSLQQLDSWSYTHDAFNHEPAALNFTVAGHVINWRDGLFSTTLGDPDSSGRRKLYFHPLVSTKEYSVYSDELKTKGNQLNVMMEGDKGPNTQSGSHGYHSSSRTIFFANVAQDAILCWNVDKPLVPENVGIAAQDHEKLVYISGAKLVISSKGLLANLSNGGQLFSSVCDDYVNKRLKMHQTTGIQTGEDDTTATTPPILNPSPKGAGATFAKKLSATLNRFTRQPLIICSGTKVPITFHVPSNSQIPKSPAILNPKPLSYSAAKGSPTANPVTKPLTIPNQATIFAAPNNNIMGLANLFKGKLPLTAEPSITTQPIITSQPIPTVSATIKRPAVFSLPAPATVSPPKRYTSPLKRPANINNAKNLVNPCQCQCNKTKHLISAQTNTGDCPIGIVINDNKITNRKRSIVGKDEGPPNKKILDEDGEICPVCLESCTNSGDHRLVALKCGHLFGANCIQTWLRGNKKCPTCQRRAILPDLRNIYARKLAGPDPVGKPGVRSIGVRAVRRSKRRRRYQEVNSQSNDQCSNEAL